MNQGSALLGLFVGSAAVGLGLFPSAFADHYYGGTGQEGCSGANSPQLGKVQNYYYDDLEPESSSAVTWNRTENINPTQMDTTLNSSYSASVTDVWVGDRNYVDYCGVDWYGGPSDPDGGAVGMGNCYRKVDGSGQRCDQHDLRLNNYFTKNTTVSNVRGLACHEGGHTLGLGHRSGENTCMPQGYPKPANQYDGHDRDSINKNA